MPDLGGTRLSIAELVKTYKSRELSPVEVTQRYLDRIERYNDEFHAYQHVTAKLALEQASEAEQRYAQDDHTPPLLGVPISIKDAFHIRGEVTTLGSRLYRDHVAKTDSGVVRRLRAAGAVFTGKTNTAEFGQAATTDNLLGPDTANPWDTTRTPGGSSGGAAASVAADLSHAAIGSDGGGSVRIPAAFTGLVGVKPSVGLVRDERGFRGMSDFVCPGPLTHCVADAREILGVLTESEYVRQHPRTPMRIAFDANPQGWPVEPGVASVVQFVADTFTRMGHHVVERSLPISGWEELFGPLVLDDEHRERGHLLAEYADEMTRYERATLRAAAELDPQDATTALAKLPEYRQKINAIFDEFDVVLTPATAVPAFPLGARPASVNGTAVDKLWGAYPFPVPFNVAGIPAATIPCGVVDELPIGVQLAARENHEAKLLDACELLEEAVAFDPTPMLSRWPDTGATG